MIFFRKSFAKRISVKSLLKAIKMIFFLTNFLSGDLARHFSEGPLSQCGSVMKG